MFGATILTFMAAAFLDMSVGLVTGEMVLAGLGELLVRHGLACVENEPGMAIDLLTLGDGLTTPPALAIERVGDVEGLRQWCDIFALAFGLPDGAMEAMLDVEVDLGAGRYSWRRLYVGRLRGEPVATSLLFLGAGVAGIYGVGTVPDARGQGIGKAMTVVPMLEARAMGYRIGVLHASSMGLGVYRQLGFREYCRLCRYVWPGG
jgi:ribosomal protein S18 acetylase RimI-like enzyme